MNSSAKCAVEGCGRGWGSFVHRLTAKECGCGLFESAQHHEFQSEEKMVTTTKRGLQINDLEDALKAAGIERPQLPGLVLTLEVRIPAEVINAAKADEGWGSDDPVADMIAAIEETSYPASEVEVTSAAAD